MTRTKILFRMALFALAVALLGLSLNAERVSAQSIINHCGTLAGDEVWAGGPDIHVVTCDITIPAARSLTIEAGAIVKFATASDIFVEGTLLVLGVEGNPVYLTSLTDDSLGGDTNANGPSAGAVRHWGHIRFRNNSDDSSVVTRAVIRFSGDSGYNSNNEPPIRLENAAPSLSYITFTDNLLNGVQLVGGTWQTTTWNNTTVIYNITGDVTIPAANTLTIAPDMKLKFAGGVDLYIEGRLDAQGTQVSPVNFTSLTDDTLCGIGAFNESICDTNNNGPSAGATRHWGHIRFRNNSDDSSIITRAVIRFSGDSGYNSNNEPPIRLENAAPSLSYITFTDNVINGVDVSGGTWQTDTWDNTTLVHVIRGDVTIAPANTLTIVPDMKLKLVGGADLYVNGRIDVQGTENQPIYFTSLADDTLCGIGANNEPICDSDNNGPSAGAVRHWGHIRFTSGSDDTSILTRAVIRFSGRRSSNYNDPPIRLENASPSISYITFTDNLLNGVQIAGGEWQTDTWDNTTVVYEVVGDLTIPAANTLTIVPDMKLKFAGNTDLYVNGRLDVQGTENQPIYFTSLADDTLCGIGANNEPICDSDNNGATVGSIGNWGQIRITGGVDEPSVISRAIVRFGGGGNNPVIRSDNATPTISRTVIRDNYIGVERNGVASPVLVCNDIYANQNFGVRNNNADTVLIAENQWWGNPSGPAHESNPAGTGQSVSNGVDFTPWGVSSCIYPPPIAPSNLTVAPGNGNALVLNWQDNSPDESGFVIERASGAQVAEADQATWSAIGKTDTNATTYADDSAACGATYTYRVRAARESDAQHSANSNEVSASTPACPVVIPSAPTSLTAAPIVRGMIQLHWTDNSTNETGFQIERQREGETNWVSITTTSANATQYRDTLLANGVVHRYRICAALQNANICSSYSNTVQARTHYVTMVTPVDR